MSKRNFKSTLGIYLRGLAMGAADVVPGVSGGTIAFITGIYEEFIRSLSHIDAKAFQLLIKFDFKGFWKHINGSFLLPLFLGIATSIFTLAKIITQLLENQPIIIWSFFFGLILASIFIIGKMVTKWDSGVIISLIICTILSYYITIATPSNGPDTYAYLFMSGSLAIMAMILPGISGAFILLLLGSYFNIMTAVKSIPEALSNGDNALLTTSLGKIGVFALGAILGLMIFSRVLNWLFTHKRNLTLASLTGFMVGSLNKVWPWKQVLSTRVNSAGEEVPFLEKSIWPSSYDGNPQIMAAIGMMAVGILIIWLLDKYGQDQINAE